MYFSLIVQHKNTNLLIDSQVINIWNKCNNYNNYNNSNNKNNENV